MDRKFRFYDEHGVEEYYLCDPDALVLSGWQRRLGRLKPVERVDSWVSPRLGVCFDLSDEQLVVWQPDGTRFLTFLELDEGRREAQDAAERASRRAEQARAEAEQARRQAEQAGQQAEQARRQAEQARAETERAQGEAERARANAERLAAQLQALGVEPEV